MDEEPTIDWFSASLQLIAGIQQLSDRGLSKAAQWSAELLQNITSNHPEPKSHEKSAQVPAELRDPKIDCSKVGRAKSYFSTREYRRAAHQLSGCDQPKAIFIRNYSLFLAGEEYRKTEEAELGEGALVANPELPAIHAELSRRYRSGELDGFCMYLYAVVLKHLRESPVDPNVAVDVVSKDLHLRASNLDQSVSQSHVDDSVMTLEEYHVDEFSVESEAFQRAMLIGSIRVYPWNWSAWVELTRAVKDGVMLKRILPLLPEHLLKRFWYAHTLLELNRDEAALEAYLRLYADFPHHVYLKSQIAIAHHNLRNADSAMELFEEVAKEDPFRLDSVDIFSNILYIKDDRAALRHLAHRASLVDKFNPRTCCAIGNLYSLSGEHTKAILYYLRALKLEPTYIDAWTLIGHEYIQLRDAHHAIAAYRRAVDSRADAWRAWYGLGQAYELLYMPQYALYYYEHAAELRPQDSRMWCALGACYKVMGQLDNTLLCYHRAEANQDKDGQLIHLLADLYKKLGRKADAAAYYTRYLNAHERDSTEPQHIVTALHFLAHYYKEKGDFQLSLQYCSRLLDFNGPEKEEIRALMREISSSASSQSVVQISTFIAH